jgi:hypothetical protein
MHVDLESPQMVGATPVGTRQVWIVKSGSFEGPGLRGEVLAGGGDWALIRSDGVVQLDVRATVRTHDGALVYATYSGLIVLKPEVAARVFAGEDVPLSEYYFYTNPMFQTAAERYAWLNQVVAVGRGKVVPGGVEYRVWAVRDPA